MKRGAANVVDWVERNRTFLHRITVPLALATFAVSLGFVVVYLSHNWPSDPMVQWSKVALAAAIYLASHLTTAATWPTILKGLGEPIPFSKGMLIGMIAQVGKYLPGNAAHYFGRAILAKRAHIAYRTSGLSTIIELTLVVFAAAIIGAAALTLAPDIPIQAYLTVALFFLAVVPLCRWSRRSGHQISLFGAATLLFAISLALSGLSFSLLLGTHWAIPAFALAWLVGFLLPGAPAGIGVREAMLVAMLSAFAQPDALALAIVLHRILTAASDGLVATASYVAFLWKMNKSAKEV